MQSKWARKNSFDHSVHSPGDRDPLGDWSLDTAAFSSRRTRFFVWRSRSGRTRGLNVRSCCARRARWWEGAELRRTSLALVPRFCTTFQHSQTPWLCAAAVLKSRPAPPAQNEGGHAHPCPETCLTGATDVFRAWARLQAPLRLAAVQSPKKPSA